MKKYLRRVFNKKNLPWFIISAAILLILIVSRFPISGPGIKIYFLKDGKLAPVSRSVEGGSIPLTIAKSLTAGPTIKEQDDGYYTEIPDGTEVLSVARQNGSLVVDFNSKLETYGGGANRIQGLVGQIVYSFTEISGVGAIKITVNGKTEVILGGEGFVIDKPLSRKDLNL